MTQFVFTEVKDETLEQKALRVCATIVSCGLGIRGGEICAGGNNLKAQNAVDSISDEDCLKLTTLNDPILYEAAMMIGCYASEIYSGAGATVTRMLEAGWKTDAKPLNYDVNAAGAKLASYAEPTGQALAFAEAFGLVEPQQYNRSIGEHPVFTHPTPHGGILNAGPNRK